MTLGTTNSGGKKGRFFGKVSPSKENPATNSLDISCSKGKEL